MGAVATKTRADLRRRRLQSVALALVLFLATAAATLSLNILVASHEPFERAFAAANGAHLVIAYDGTIDDARLAATAHAAGVTASAGPYPIGEADFEHLKGGRVFGQSISGRPQADASIDAITMIAGRWWQRPGEVVLDRSIAAVLEKQVGDRVTVYSTPQASGGKGPDAVPGPPEAPGTTGPRPTLSATVVGIAGSVSTPDVAAWLSPSDVTLLMAGRPTAKEMLYRVEPAATQADLVAAKARITAALDPRAVTGQTTWLDLRTSVNKTADLYVPVLLAFSIFALLAAAFAIANVISGIVLSSYRDIGVMKAVGFTPRQVSTMLLVQILAPATLGTALGVAAGLVASQPTVVSTTEAFGLPPAFAFSPLVLLVVPLAALGVASVAALGPAIRAGRLSPVEAMTRGTMPAVGGLARRLRGLGFRLPVALPVRLGLTAGIAHPARSGMTLGALVVGVAAATFAIGTNLSLLRIKTDIDRGATAPVRVELPSPDRAADVATTIAGLSGTARFVGLGQGTVSVPLAGSMPFVGYDGDASWIGFPIIHGRWFAGPGEAVAPTNVFRQAGKQIGDTIQVQGDSGAVTLTLVGEIFDTGDESRDGLVLRGSLADLRRLDATAAVDRFEIQPVAGTSARDYRTAFSEATQDAIAVSVISDLSSDADFLLFLSVVAFLGVVLVAISIGGVFNTVLLETRQRWRELAILKAIGLTPLQVLVQVVSSVLVVGLLAGFIGVPLGLLIERGVIAYMGETAAHLAIPESAFDVLLPVAYVGLALSGLAIAVVGAFLPARRAASLRVAPVLQAE